MSEPSYRQPHTGRPALRPGMAPPVLLKRSHASLVREVLIACNRLPGVNLFAVDVGGKDRGHGTPGISDIIGWRYNEAWTNSPKYRLSTPVFMEIKVGRDKLRPKQRAFLELARKDNCIALEIRSVEEAVYALQ